MVVDDRKEKRIKCERGETHGASADHPSRLPDLNFPLSTDRGPACLVKVRNHVISDLISTCNSEQQIFLKTNSSLMGINFFLFVSAETMEC